MTQTHWVLGPPDGCGVGPGNPVYINTQLGGGAPRLRWLRVMMFPPGRSCSLVQNMLTFSTGLQELDSQSRWSVPHGGAH